MEKFVFNDQSIKNSYGFKVKTDGIDLTRFNNNPVMLDQHWNSTNYVLGRWTDLETKGGLLLGMPEFDTEDPQAKKIQGKVERNYIKSCSMGIRFNPSDMAYENGELVLQKCELMEVSIVAIPSNANALKLYNQEGELLTDEAISNLCLSVQESNNYNQKIMSKIVLQVATLVALGFTDAPSDGVEQSVLESKLLGLANDKKKLEGEKTALEQQVQDLKAEKETALKAGVQGIVETAIKEGKLKADAKDNMIALGLSNPQALNDMLAAIPAKQTLGAGVTPATGTGNQEVKSLDDFQKLSHEEQLAFKVDNPEGYKKLFNA